MEPLSALAGLTVLVIGDSHVAFPGSMQMSLHDLLLAEGAGVHTYGGCAMRPDGYYSGDAAVRTVSCGFGERHGGGEGQTLGGEVVAPRVTDLLDRHAPDLVLIVMGDNLAAYGREVPDDLIAEQAAALTGMLEAGVPCFWAGPTWGADGPDFVKPDGDVRELARHLAGAVNPCTFLDGLALLTPEEADVRDGIHLTVEGYANWAEAIVDEMLTDLRETEAEAASADRPGDPL